MNNQYTESISLAKLIESVNDCCVKYRVTSCQLVADYLIANANFTGWDISPECLNDYVTAISANALWWSKRTKT